MSLIPTVRKEVHDYLSSCEHLLAFAMTLKTSSFSQDELDLLQHYAAEIAEKILQAQPRLTNS
jgi:hypothetical protein